MDQLATYIRKKGLAAATSAAITSIRCSSGKNASPLYAPPPAISSFESKEEAHSHTLKAVVRYLVQDVARYMNDGLPGRIDAFLTPVTPVVSSLLRRIALLKSLYAPPESRW